MNALNVTRRSISSDTPGAHSAPFRRKPVRVVLRFDAAAAPDASAFLFHPGQTVDEQDDGTVTVSFEAGGLDEMCWHLVTWGETVIVEKPARLRPTSSQDVRDACRPSSINYRTGSTVQARQ